MRLVYNFQSTGIVILFSLKLVRRSHYAFVKKPSSVPSGGFRNRTASSKELLKAYAGAHP